MIKLEDWENMKVNLGDEYFEEIRIFHPFLGWYTAYFEGKITGTKLEPKFSDVLEND